MVIMSMSALSKGQFLSLREDQVASMSPLRCHFQFVPEAKVFQYLSHFHELLRACRPDFPVKLSCLISYASDHAFSAQRLVSGAFQFECLHDLAVELRGCYAVDAGGIHDVLLSEPDFRRLPWLVKYISRFGGIAGGGNAY